MAPKPSADKKRSRLSDRPPSPTPAAATMNFYVDWPHGLKLGSGSNGNVDRGRERRARGSGKNKSSSRDSSAHPDGSTAATTSDSTASTADSVSMYMSDETRYYGPYSGLPSVALPNHSAQYYPGWSSQIHTLLDADSSPLIWDVRQPPTSLTAKRSTSRIFGPNALSFPVTSSGTGHIRIISKDFPWSVEIGPKSRALTASEVLHHLYDLLQRPFDDAVWGAADDSRRDIIERAWKRREENENKVKNVDWLGKKYMFKGFCKDEKFVAKRQIPGGPTVTETWVLSFAKA